jgi:hypothetical protein
MPQDDEEREREREREREICLTQAMSATKIIRLPAPREDKHAKHNQDTDLTQERASVRPSVGKTNKDTYRSYHEQEP